MLTDREKKLMFTAYECGFHDGCFDSDERIGISTKNRFDAWLNEDVAEGGLTVEMLLHHEAGELKC